MLRVLELIIDPEMSGITTQVLCVLELCYRWQKFLQQMVFKRKRGRGLEQDIPVTANFSSNSFSPSMPAQSPAQAVNHPGISITCHFLEVGKHS